MKTHTLKTSAQYYKAIVSGNKTFELRVNDRQFEKGDLLRLKEYDEQTDSYSGCYADCEVLEVYQFKWIVDGHVIMSIRLKRYYDGFNIYDAITTRTINKIEPFHRLTGTEPRLLY